MIPDVLGIAVVLIVGFWIGRRHGYKPGHKAGYASGFKAGKAEIVKNILTRRVHEASQGKRSAHSEQQPG